MLLMCVLYFNVGYKCSKCPSGTAISRAREQSRCSAGGEWSTPCQRWWSSGYRIVTRPTAGCFYFHSACVFHCHYLDIDRRKPGKKLWKKTVGLESTSFTLLWPPFVADADVIFLPCGFFLSLFLFFFLA